MEVRIKTVNFLRVCFQTVQSQFSKQSDLNSVHFFGPKLCRKHFSVSTKPSKSQNLCFWKEQTNESARMNAPWNAPIRDRFSSLCARVFSPAAAILEREKTLGTRLEDLKQTRRGGSACLQEKACFCFCFFLFQWPKMITSVLVTWTIVDCNLAVRVCSVVLVVRCRSIEKCPIFCSFADTEFRPDKIRKFSSCLWLLKKSYGFRK